MKKMVRGGALLLAVCLAFSAVGAAMPAEADVAVPMGTVEVAREVTLATPAGGTQTTVEGADGSVTTLLCEGGTTRIAVSLAEAPAGPFALPVDACALTETPLRLSLECADGARAALALPVTETDAVTIQACAADGGVRLFSAQPDAGWLTLALADGETAVITAP